MSTRRTRSNLSSAQSSVENTIEGSDQKPDDKLLDDYSDERDLTTPPSVEFVSTPPPRVSPAQALPPASADPPIDFIYEGIMRPESQVPVAQPPGAPVIPQPGVALPAPAAMEVAAGGAPAPPVPAAGEQHCAPPYPANVVQVVQGQRLVLENDAAAAAHDIYGPQVLHPNAEVPHHPAQVAIGRIHPLTQSEKMQTGTIGAICKVETGVAPPSLPHATSVFPPHHNILMSEGLPNRSPTAFHIWFTSNHIQTTNNAFSLPFNMFTDEVDKVRQVMTNSPTGSGIGDIWFLVPGLTSREMMDHVKNGCVEKNYVSRGRNTEHEHGTIPIFSVGHYNIYIPAYLNQMNLVESTMGNLAEFGIIREDIFQKRVFPAPLFAMKLSRDLLRQPAVAANLDMLTAEARQRRECEYSRIKDRPGPGSHLILSWEHFTRVVKAQLVAARNLERGRPYSLFENEEYNEYRAQSAPQARPPIQHDDPAIANPGPSGHQNGHQNVHQNGHPNGHQHRGQNRNHFNFDRNYNNHGPNRGNKRNYQQRN